MCYLCDFLFRKVSKKVAKRSISFTAAEVSFKEIELVIVCRTSLFHHDGCILYLKQFRPLGVTSKDLLELGLNFKQRVLESGKYTFQDSKYTLQESKLREGKKCSELNCLYNYIQDIMFNVYVLLLTYY